MTTARKTAPATAKAANPVRPRPDAPDIAASHAKIARRFPKVLAELAK
ncbi:MAG: hypothetical protein P4L73_18425 [Caulobacteraceae bacterium]|nr:hypothetical protein [Caulobacteraceae bacterium]